MNSENLFELCSFFLKRYGFGNETLVSLLLKWRAFVEECEGGYRWDYSEYLNEVRCRTLLQRLLDEPRIAGAEEFKEIFDELACLDEKFKCLLQSDIFLGESDNWWEARVLIRAGEEYCFYMKKVHGVSVECVDC